MEKRIILFAVLLASMASMHQAAAQAFSTRKVYTSAHAGNQVATIVRHDSTTQQTVSYHEHSSYHEFILDADSTFFSMTFPVSIEVKDYEVMCYEK